MNGPGKEERVRNVEALKKLYVKLGGDADDVSGITLISEMIEAISALVDSGLPGSLPPVKAADNGKVLKVVDGAWTAASLQ